MSNEQKFSKWVKTILCWNCGNYEEVDESKYNAPYFCHGTGNYMKGLITISQGCSLFKEDKPKKE